MNLETSSVSILSDAIWVSAICGRMIKDWISFTKMEILKWVGTIPRMVKRNVMSWAVTIWARMGVDPAALTLASKAVTYVTPVATCVPQKSMETQLLKAQWSWHRWTSWKLRIYHATRANSESTLCPWEEVMTQIWALWSMILGQIISTSFPRLHSP